MIRKHYGEELEGLQEIYKEDPRLLGRATTIRKRTHKHKHISYTIQFKF